MQLYEGSFALTSRTPIVVTNGPSGMPGSGSSPGASPHRSAWGGANGAVALVVLEASAARRFEVTFGDRVDLVGGFGSLG